MNQSRRFVIAVLLSFTVIIPVTAQNRTSWERRPAQIYSYDERGALTLPSNVAPAAVVEQFLTARGHDAVTARTIAHATVNRDQVAGEAAGPRVMRSDDSLTHVRADQRVEGLVVYGSYIKAALNEQGQLVHLIENLAPVSAITRAAIDEEQALAVALGRLHPRVAAPRRADRAEDGRVLFTGNSFFYTPPTATRVLASMPDGLLHEAFLVETWTNRKNLLHHTLVSGEGEVLNIELRTNSDQYFVYLEDPGKEAAQTLVSGPAPVSPAGTAPSPNGWLTGTQKTTNIVGNNVRAYLDVVSNNLPDSGGTNVTNGSFTTVHNRTVAPSTTANRAVAVQNLFYLNNRIHDILYTAGFNESELNFQTNNFSRGGLGLDAVNAEAQDGGGIDNANFATPGDGLKPRMQMYLWTGKPSHQVVLGASLFSAAGAAFGPALTSTGKTGALSATSPADGCTAISTTLTGKIAIIDRGTCDFVVKVKNAQLKGAVGVIVANHAAGGDSLMSMGGTDGTITIPAVFVGLTDGATLKAAAGTSSTIRITTPAPLQRDGDLDSDIVYHEYGHGLTWRMIGSMSGPMSGAIGEGMGDVLAIVLNGDDRVGEYSSSDARGIRSAPYTSFPRTYGSVTGANGVHFDGEVYAAIGWKLRELYLGAGLTETDLLRDLVQGMRFTPAAPNYQQMRDGILAATTTNDCKVWTAFALYGVGSGATSTVSGSTVTVSESFVIPAGVCP